jgi:hypothetical protein
MLSLSPAMDGPASPSGPVCQGGHAGPSKEASL